jgi:hypothetical protein
MSVINPVVLGGLQLSHRIKMPCVLHSIYLRTQLSLHKRQSMEAKLGSKNVSLTMPTLHPTILEMIKTARLM